MSWCACVCMHFVDMSAGVGGMGVVFFFSSVHWVVVYCKCVDSAKVWDWCKWCTRLSRAFLSCLQVRMHFGLFIRTRLSPDIIPSGWLGWKCQLTKIIRARHTSNCHHYDHHYWSYLWRKAFTLDRPRLPVTVNRFSLSQHHRRFQ